MHVVDVGEGKKAKGGGRDLQSRHEIGLPTVCVITRDKLEADHDGGDREGTPIR